MKNNQKLPLNIQLFAEEGGTTPAATTGQNVATQQAAAPAIDYGKIQQMIDSRNQSSEDTILKSYFQKEGLSPEEAKKAIEDFKTQREESKQKEKVDNENLQNQLKDKDALILKQNIEHEAFLQALDLGVETKTIPYLIKLADFNGVVDDKGAISGDKVKESLNKVLTDVPGLKKSENQAMKGFQIGADNSQGSNNGVLDDTLARVFGTKK